MIDNIQTKDEKPYRHLTVTIQWDMEKVNHIKLCQCFIDHIPNYRNFIQGVWCNAKLCSVSPDMILSPVWTFGKSQSLRASNVHL